MTTQTALFDRTSGREGFWLVLAALTIFLGAFLLFQVELLMAKLILPWFGGSVAVWLACLMFFQVTLLAGYLYAHVSATRIPPIWRTWLHIALLVASLAFLPVLPAETWKPEGDRSPLPLILGLLATTIGLPFLLLSSATPLLQTWIAGVRQTTSPRSIYRLYALSNLGSMLALLSYPLLVEPSLPTKAQAWIWSAAYAIFAVLYIIAAWHHRAIAPAERFEMPVAAEGAVRPSDRYFWILLPLAASALLLALTNHALRNIAPIPLFWMVPLALYLLSFIVCFDRPHWYYRPAWLALFAMVAALMSLALGRGLAGNRTIINLGFWLAGLFVSCMVCHGELARLKPPPRSLTSYYLLIAAGGAAGGICVAVIAPLIFFADFYVLIILPATVLLAIVAIWRSRAHWPVFDKLLFAAACLILAGFTLDMARSEQGRLTGAVFQERNFYGPLRVQDYGDIRQLVNGTIEHGAEYVGPFQSEEPVSYYARTSGLGIALSELGSKGPLKVGVIGLGAGTIAAYAREGDAYRFYDINPAVPGIARTYFHYLDRCKATCDIVLGDARLSLEREEPQAFDLLAVDAFTSDSIPVHLLTREAFALYYRHLKPGGILAIHTTNTYVTLAPIVALAAMGDGKRPHLFADAKRGDAIERTEWILLSSDEGLFSQGPLSYGLPVSVPNTLRPWTDDYTSIWQSLR